jgi:hypothetical protein
MCRPQWLSGRAIIGRALIVRDSTRPSTCLVAADAGNVVIEGVIYTAVFIIFIAAIFVGVRLRSASRIVTQAAAAAAREASIARTPAHARAAAIAGARSTLRERGLHCAPRLTVDLSGFQQPLGRPGTITARVECTVQLADLAVPGMPGMRLIAATHRSLLDPYRAR